MDWTRRTMAEDFTMDMEARMKQRRREERGISTRISAAWMMKNGVKNKRRKSSKMCKHNSRLTDFFAFCDSRYEVNRQRHDVLIPFCVYDFKNGLCSDCGEKSAVHAVQY